jgi:hypothetical protein
MCAVEAKKKKKHHTRKTRALVCTAEFHAHAVALFAAVILLYLYMISAAGKKTVLLHVESRRRVMHKKEQDSFGPDRTLLFLLEKKAITFPCGALELQLREGREEAS